VWPVSGEGTCIQVSRENREEKRPLGRSRHGWHDTTQWICFWAANMSSVLFLYVIGVPSRHAHEKLYLVTERSYKEEILVRNRSKSQILQLLVLNWGTDMLWYAEFFESKVAVTWLSVAC
jgi:hypothetical protein